MEDISLKIGKHLLNYRVSAVIKNNNKILTHHGIEKDHYTLPGGRVKDGESTIEALKREIREEMGLEVKYLKPFAFIENLFEMNGERYHELLVAHELEFVEKSIYTKEKIMPIEKEKKGKLEFVWLELQDFDDINFVPRKLKECIKSDLNQFVHIINVEK